MRWLDGITDSMDVSSSKLRKIVKDRDAWHAEVHKIGRASCRERVKSKKGATEDEMVRWHH